jgi:hypothetical protein
MSKAVFPIKRKIDEKNRVRVQSLTGKETKGNKEILCKYKELFKPKN